MEYCSGEIYGFGLALYSGIGHDSELIVRICLNKKGSCTCTCIVCLKVKVESVIYCVYVIAPYKSQAVLAITSKMGKMAGCMSSCKLA